MQLDFFGLFLRVTGEVMIGFTAVMVHRRFWKEHKIDEAVYREMKQEQIIGIIGILFIITGFLLEALTRFP